MTKTNSQMMYFAKTIDKHFAVIRVSKLYSV